MSLEKDGVAPEKPAAEVSRMPWAIGVSTFFAIVVLGTALTVGVAKDTKQPTSARLAPASVPLETPKLHAIQIPSLGLSVVQPTGWHVVSVQQHAQNLRTVEMDDKHIQQLVVRYANVPIVALSKYKEPYPDLNPSFKINVRPAGGFIGRPANEILAAALPTLTRAFADMSIVEGPVITTVSNHPAAYARLAYTMRAAGQTFPTISEFWIVPRGSVFYMIGVGTRADERNGTRAEARAIVDGMRIQ